MGKGVDQRMGIRVGRSRRFGGRSGLSLLEITIALTVVSTVLLASVGAFGSSISAVNSARRTSRASVFLETVMEDLSAQSYDNLLAFNGNRIYDQTTAAKSSFAVDLTVFVAALDLERIDAVVVDLHSNREIGRVSTMRAKR